MSRWRATATVAAVLAGAATGGCGSADQAITRGGVVAGATLSIYSLLPEPGRGSSRDIVDGQKLALHDAGGEAGGYAINSSPSTRARRAAATARARRRSCCATRWRTRR
jgi:hypothetical protein